MTAVTILILI